MVNFKGFYASGMSYAIVLLLVFALVVIYLSSYLTFFSVLLIVLGVALGAVASYGLFLSFTHDHGVQLFPGEAVLLQSASPKTHLVIKHIGDKTFQYDPQRLDIFLTNLGIIAEIPGTGKIGFYIPHDKVLEYTSQHSGILVSYLDASNQFSEAIIFVDDKNTWMNMLYSIYSKMASERDLSK